MVGRGAQGYARPPPVFEGGRRLLVWFSFSGYGMTRLSGRTRPAPRFRPGLSTGSSSITRSARPTPTGPGSRGKTSTRSTASLPSPRAAARRQQAPAVADSARTHTWTRLPRAAGTSRRAARTRTPRASAAVGPPGSLRRVRVGHGSAVLAGAVPGLCVSRAVGAGGLLAARRALRRPLSGRPGRPARFVVRSAAR